MPVAGIVSEIYLYPVKSLRGIKLDKAIVTKRGIAHPNNISVVDRKWLIVDQNFNFLTQRNHPKMALIQTSLDCAFDNIDGDCLVLSAPNKEEIRVPIKHTSDKVKCRVWNLHINGYRYGGEIAEWLSDYLQVKNVDLVSFGDDLEPRKMCDIDKSLEGRKEEIIYSDDSPMLLISENSLNNLNSRLKEKKKEEVSMRNFRPNLVVKDTTAAFAEDNWKTFKIGHEASFVQIKQCARCLQTTVNPDKGEKNRDQEPLNTLKEYRLNPKISANSPLFGINISCNNEGSIVKVGDRITLSPLLKLKLTLLRLKSNLEEMGSPSPPAFTNESQQNSPLFESNSFARRFSFNRQKSRPVEEFSRQDSTDRRRSTRLESNSTPSRRLSFKRLTSFSRQKSLPVEEF